MTSIDSVAVGAHRFVRCALFTLAALGCAPAEGGEATPARAAVPPDSSRASAPLVANADGASSANGLRVSAGYSHSCALRASGQLYCWGDNTSRQLGVGVDSEAVLSPRAVGGGHVFHDVAAGSPVTCAIDARGAAFCWGASDEGQLGTGVAVDSAALPKAVAGGHRFTTIVATAAGTCALDAEGAAWCWGRYEARPAQEGAAPARSRPTRVATALHFRALASRLGGACGVGTDGTTYCWGPNSAGELGDGTSSWRAAPVAVASLSKASGLALGESHSCAIDAAGAAWCWGDNSAGQLGTGRSVTELPRSATPVRVAGARHYRAISAQAAGNTTCAIDLEGGLWCWGANDREVLGAQPAQQCTIQGTSRTRPCATEPIAVAPALRFAQISVGEGESCGVTGEDRLYCWGSPEYADDSRGAHSAAVHEVVLPGGGAPR